MGEKWKLYAFFWISCSLLWQTFSAERITTKGLLKEQVNNENNVKDSLKLSVCVLFTTHNLSSYVTSSSPRGGVINFDGWIIITVLFLFLWRLTSSSFITWNDDLKSRTHAFSQFTSCQTMWLQRECHLWSQIRICRRDVCASSKYQ